MGKRYVVIFLLVGFCCVSSAQTKNAPSGDKPAGSAGASEIYEYDQFYLIYIDNSRAERGDGLAGLAKDMIDSLGQFLKKSEGIRFLIYGSNGITPEICDDPANTLKSIERITGGDNSQFPDDKFLERDQIRSALYAQPFLVTKSITLDYFITEYFAKSLLKEDASILTTALAAEFRFLLSKIPVPVTINLYYTNVKGEVKKEQILTAVSFLNKDKNIQINTVPLN